MGPLVVIAAFNVSEKLFGTQYGETGIVANIGLSEKAVTLESFIRMVKYEALRAV